MGNKESNINSRYIIHNKKKYTYTITETNTPSEEAIENCRKYVNILMKNL